jgi:hypothetical protein
MTLKTIYENLQDLAAENMTENGIDPDYWCDHEGEYIAEILLDLTKMNDE